MSESTPPVAPSAQHGRALIVWRTVLAAVVIVLLVTVLLLIVALHALGKGLQDIGPNTSAAFGSLCILAGIAITALSGKALGEHLGNGTGSKGAWAALTTSAKPGEPQEKPQ